MTESEAKQRILDLVGPPWTDADIFIRKEPKTHDWAFSIEAPFGAVGGITHGGQLLGLPSWTENRTQKEHYEQLLLAELAYRCLESPYKRRCTELEQALKASEERELEAKGQLFDLAKACLQWKNLYLQARGCAVKAVDKYMMLAGVFQEISVDIERLRRECADMLEKNPLANGM